VDTREDSLLQSQKRETVDIIGFFIVVTVSEIYKYIAYCFSMVIENFFTVETLFQWLGIR
jgi:hypothetical protein